MMGQPTMLGACARAASSTEARFRIDVPIVTYRVARVIALDEQSADLLRGVGAMTSRHSHLLWAGSPPDIGRTSDLLEFRLNVVGGESESELGAELADADLVVLVAGARANLDRVRAVGARCRARGVETVGLILGGTSGSAAVVAAVRPYVGMLLDAIGQADLAELLLALRA
jgi:hypothetical protein